MGAKFHSILQRRRLESQRLNFALEVKIVRKPGFRTGVSSDLSSKHP